MKINDVTHEGELDLNGLKIPCYVLKDGSRVLSTYGLQTALGVTGNEPTQRSSGRLAEILTSKAISPYLSEEYQSSKVEPMEVFKGKKKILAYKAEMLPDICEAVLKARDSGVELGTRQLLVAKQADILIRALAKVGLIALIDEATGYQYDREKNELQAILKVLISDEILAWQQAFHLTFYKEIFRLWGVPFTDQYIKRKPQFIGRLTNNLVYKNMPKGVFVLDALKTKTPKTKGGNLKYRLHQSLTADEGREALKKVIYSIETLAAISESKDQFLKLVQNRYGQTSLDLDSVGDLDTPKPKEELSSFNKNLTTALKFNPKDKE